jgi:type IV pilus assembly protein PilP
MMAPDGRTIFISALLIIALAVGCGDQSESEAPKKPPGLRKKIAVSREPVSKVVKSQSPGRVAPSKAQVDLKKEKDSVVTAEPSAPDKRDLIQPKKSDFLALAEGLTKRPEYFYDPRGKHDPFESLFETETGHVGVAPTKKRVQKKRMPLTPLQMVSLGQLKLVAIVLSPNGNKALVEEPSGKGYVISKGTYLGQNYERVKAILKDRVIVEGEVEDFITGSTKLQTTELKLQKKVGDV